MQKKFCVDASFDDYVNVDNDVASSKLLTTDEICELTQEKENEDELSDTDTEIVSEPPSYLEAVKGLETFRRYVEWQENVPDEIFKNLQQLDSFHTQLKERKRKQTTLSDYFAKVNENSQ